MSDFEILGVSIRRRRLQLCVGRLDKDIPFHINYLGEKPFISAKLTAKAQRRLRTAFAFTPTRASRIPGNGLGMASIAFFKQLIIMLAFITWTRTKTFKVD